MKKKTILDGKGHVVGYETNDLMLDRHGKIVARYNKSSDRTLDERGRVIGVGDQRLRKLDRSEDGE